jgi:hypothetical protein
MSGIVRETLAARSEHGSELLNILFHSVDMKNAAALCAAAFFLHPFSTAPAAAESQADHDATLEDTVRSGEFVQTQDAGRLIEWIALSGDNGELPYIVIDKRSAAMSLFDGEGKLLGETPVLIGVGEGDDSTPGIGGMSLSDIGPAERTTPAGRFVSKLGRAVGWNSVLWVDYSTSVALHAVTKDNKKERRPQRLQSPTVEDNRITFGCINIDTSFYLKKVKTTFQNGGIVYILPETKSLDEVFPSVRLLPLLKAEQPQTS